jgi:hypothetical protein
VSRPRIVTREVVVVAVLQALVLTILAALLPTWQDEEFTMATTAHGIAYAIHRALTYELQAPLYFAVLAALRSVNGSVFYAREWSVACQVATTFACAWIARRIWPHRNPWIFCALVAVNWFSFFAGLEIRTYALALLEEAVLLGCAIDGFLLGTSLRARLAFVLVAVVGLYTQYFIAFDFAAFFVALLIARRFAALPAYLGSLAVALVAFAPLALFVRTQASDTLSIEGGASVGFGGMFLHPSNLVLVHIFSDGRIGHVAWIALFLALIVAAIVGRPRLDARKWAFISLFVVTDLIYAYLFDVAKLHLEFPRHFIALFLPQAMLAYVLVAGFTSRFATRAGVAIACIFAITNSLSIVETYGSGAKEGDSARVGALLTRDARPGDAIAVYPGDAVPSVLRYYHGTLPIAGYPRTQDPNVYQIDAALVHSEADANAAFDRLPRAKRLWFDTVLDCSGNIHGCRYVRDAIARRFRVRSEYDFFRADVLELEPIAK